MKIRNLIKITNIAFVATSLLTTLSCNDDSVGNYYTFTGETVGQYLESKPEAFSEFSAILDTTNVMSLLKAYGEYTCFAPTNSALKELYAEKSVTSYRQLSMAELKKISYDHVIKGATTRKSDFTSGRLPNKSMSDRFITITLDQDGDYLVNETSKILLDLSADSIHNGVLYALNVTLQPTEMTLSELIEDNAKKEGRITLFARALKETGLADSLLKTVDESYDPYDFVDGDIKIDNLPEKRKYGYTALIETDSTYYKSGVVTSLDDEDRAFQELIDYAKNVYDNTYPKDAGLYDNDLTNRKNPLNRFIAYHLHEKEMSRRNYVEIHYDRDYTQSITSGKSYTEYVETMCPNTLMGVTYKSSRAYNLINNSDLTFVAGKTDIGAVNGVYHEIDGVLTYNREWVSHLTTNPIRIDVAAFYPEMTNNGFRYTKKGLYIPKGFIEGLTFEETAKMKFIGPSNSYIDLLGDELWAAPGAYDVTLVTPPVPEGMYEVRMGYQANGKRGIVQLYWDKKPCGIPLNMNIKGDHSSIGFESPDPSSEDPYGYENDKMMRNRGYMKCPASIYYSGEQGWYGSAGIGRNKVSALRRILGIFRFDTDSKHIFRMKSVSEGEFMLDYIEFVPVECLETEGID